MIGLGVGGPREGGAYRGRLREIITALYGDGQAGALYAPQPVVLGQQVLYQDAAGTTPVTADGDPVGRMLDLSGNGNHATQATSAARPEYPGLSYDNVDDFLNAGLLSSVADGLFCDAGNAFYVAGCFRGSGNGAILAKAPGGGDQQTLHVYISSVDDGLRTTIRGAVTTIQSPVNDSLWHIYLIEWDGTTATARFDGGTAVELAVGIRANDTTEPVMLGARSVSSPAFPFLGEIGATVVGNGVLDPAQAAAVQSYIASSVGVSL